MLWPGNRLQTPASNLLRETPCSPTSLLTETDQSCVLGELPLKGFFQVVFPWDGQLQQHYLLAGLRHKDNVWSQGGDCNVAGETSADAQDPPTAAASLLQRLGSNSCTCSSGKGLLLPSSDKGDGFLGGSEPLHPHKSFADDFSDGLKNLIMPPAVPSISKCPGAAAEDVFQGSSLGTQRACWCLG